MIDLLLQFGVSNLCLSLILACIAWGIHTTGKRPYLAHLLWIIVLVKLITPPILTVPVIPIPEINATTAESFVDLAAIDDATSGAIVEAELADAGMSVDSGDNDSKIASSFIESGKAGLIILWLLGSLCVLVWSLVRITRFNRLLDIASVKATPEVQNLASRIARRLALKSTPTIYTTSAQISPMVWWIGGRVRILIPTALPDALDTEQLRWILAHELAHVKRKDHCVRWLEWLACVIFWWNPVTWWARRNLRINEEICCDALVLSALKPDPHSYATSLMTVVEFLASPVIRPPAVASEMNGGGFLERRFKMIINNKPVRRTQRWLRASILACTVGILPLGMASAEADTQERGDTSTEIKTTDTMLEFLTEAVANGVMDGRAAFELYSEYKAQEKQDFVDAGKCTAEQYDERLGLGFRHKIAECRISQALAEGEITEEEAASRRERLQNRMEGAQGERRMTRQEFSDAEARLQQLVDDGMITEVEKIERMSELRGQMSRRGEGKFMTQEEYDLIAQRLEMLVDEGMVSEDEAQASLEDVQIIEERQRGARSEQGARGQRGERGQHEEGIMRRVTGALAEAGIERDQMRDVMGAMRRITREMRDEGEAFELDPDMQAHLADIGLSDDQVETVVGVAQRIANTERKERRPRGDDRRRRNVQTDWDEISSRIESAVEKGDMTREEADSLHETIQERMSKENTE